MQRNPKLDRPALLSHLYSCFAKHLYTLQKATYHHLLFVFMFFLEIFIFKNVTAYKEIERLAGIKVDGKNRKIVVAVELQQVKFQGLVKLLLDFMKHITRPHKPIMKRRKEN